MLKTIKIKKQMRLDELIKYIRDNRVREKMFRTDEHGNALSNALKVDVDGLIETYFPNMHINNSFTVEVEEQITEDTVFDTLVDVNNNDEVHTTRNVSVGLYAKEQTKEIHALINGKLELIYERNDGSSQCTV